MTPRYSFVRTERCIAILVDGILFRILPDKVRFQLDRIGDDPNDVVKAEYDTIMKEAKFKKNLYGVFGYIRL